MWVDCGYVYVDYMFNTSLKLEHYAQGGGGGVQDTSRVLYQHFVSIIEKSKPGVSTRLSDDVRLLWCSRELLECGRAGL